MNDLKSSKSFPFTSSSPSPPTLPPLIKHKSWSPDSGREEAWIRRRDLQRSRSNRLSTRGITDEDLDELRGCIDLGFNFDFPSRRLSNTFPAVDLYRALNHHDPSSPSSCSSSAASSPLSVYTQGESPKEVKEKLRQWAQLVACSARRQL